MTIKLPSIVQDNLRRASEDTGFSERDLVMAFVRSGLRQLNDTGIVIRPDDVEAEQKRPSPSQP